MSTSQPSPIDAALDLLVYVPVGLALTVGEEVPKLAAKGRARLGGHFRAARMVGQFAVSHGRNQVDKRVGGARPATRPGPVAAPPAAGRPTAPSGPIGVVSTPPVAKAPAAPARRVPSARVSSSPGRPAKAAAARRRTPTSASLAIPRYDSLSASQVVSRLAGLAPVELDAVAAYEAATRGRRTILARVAQLQAR